MPTSKLPNKSTLEQLYHGRKLSLGDIAAIYNVSRPGVSAALRRHGVLLRSKSESRLLALQQGKLAGKKYHDFNRGFFDTWIPSMAYLLGLVFADGHVNRTGLSFGFGMKSKDLVDVVQGLIEDEQEPLIVNNNGYPSYRLTYHSTPMAKRLRELGVPWGKKSYTMQVPIILSGMERHFVRGYWDGDGSIGNSVIRASSRSESFLKGIRDLIAVCIGNARQGTLKSVVGSSQLPQGTLTKPAKQWILTYGSLETREIIYRWFYRDVPVGQYSPRKKDKFAQTIGMGKFI